MQILEDQKQRLNLTFPEQQPLNGVERSLTALSGIERFPRCISGGYVQQGEQWRQHGFQRAVEHQELTRHPIANLAMVVMTLDSEIGFEQLDNRQVRRSSTVRNRGAFEDQPTVSPVRMREFPDESRLSHTSLADYRDDLPVARGRAFEGERQLLNFTVTSYESGQTARRGGLQPGPCCSDPSHLVYLDPLTEAFHGNRSEVAPGHSPRPASRFRR